MKKKIELEQTGYRVRGTAYLTLWLGGSATIEMEPYHVEGYSDEAVWEGVNDNGFGCVSIDGADCKVYEVYGMGYEVFVASLLFDENGTVIDRYLPKYDPLEVG